MINVNKLLKISDIGAKNQKTREAWLEKTLKKIPNGLKILDAGAGELKYKKFCEHLKYVSQDFGQYDGEGNAEGLQAKKWDNSKLDVVSDIINIPVKDASFDAIMCVEVFEHIPEPIKAVKEFSRILKKDGYLIITASFCSMTHFAPYHFYTGYNVYWYEKILNENGFQIIDMERNGNYFEYLAQEMRRLPEIAKLYSKNSIFVKYLLKIIVKVILIILKFFSKNNKKSEELLCYGIHVLAKKK